MLNYLEFLDRDLNYILSNFPKIWEFLYDNWFKFDSNSKIKIKDYFNLFWDDFYIEKATNKQIISKNFYEFYISILKENNQNNLLNVEEITILAWNNKYNEKEKFSSLTIKRWEIISIVWPTWSGKSRLLADIEWMASRDTPTNREVLVNWIKLPKELRYSSEFKLVSQLSQNMNFIMDLTVEEFIKLHAESRGIKNVLEIVEKIIEEANILSWEKFDNTNPVTSLSWWQSRALMIADVAILSKSPIVLIDEIENAWVDRKKALSLLLREDKIVLISTHDPILALSSDKRIIIKDWGISKIIKTSDNEISLLKELEILDEKIMNYRNKLRNWDTLL